MPVSKVQEVCRTISELEDDMDRLKAFNTSFVQLADLNFEMMLDSINSVSYMTAEGNEEKVTERKQLREFLENTGTTQLGKEIEMDINSKRKQDIDQCQAVTG